MIWWVIIVAVWAYKWKKRALQTFAQISSNRNEISLIKIPPKMEVVTLEQLNHISRSPAHRNVHYGRFIQFAWPSSIKICFVCTLAKHITHQCNSTIINYNAAQINATKSHTKNNQGFHLKNSLKQVVDSCWIEEFR